MADFDCRPTRAVGERLNCGSNIAKHAELKTNLLAAEKTARADNYRGIQWVTSRPLNHLDCRSPQACGSVRDRTWYLPDGVVPLSPTGAYR